MDAKHEEKNQEDIVPENNEGVAVPKSRNPLNALLGLNGKKYYYYMEYDNNNSKSNSNSVTIIQPSRILPRPSNHSGVQSSTPVYGVQSLISGSHQKEFIENVQKWVVADSQLKKVNEKTREFRDYKSNLSTSICSYLQDNNLQNTKIEISNGEIKMFEKKEYSPLTFTYIHECLGKIISDKSHVDYIIRYLKENREIKSDFDLRRTHKD